MNSLRWSAEGTDAKTAAALGAANIAPLPERGGRAKPQAQGTAAAAQQPHGSRAEGAATSPDRPERARPVAAGTRTVPVSAARLIDKRIVTMSDRDPAAMAYKVMRTHVLQRMRANNWKTLAITSPTAGNGKTVTTINLAVTLARDHKHTVLAVDLDLRRPSLASYFFDSPVPGLSEYITDDWPIEDLLVKPGIERLAILPGNHSFTHSSEILCSPKMLNLVSEVKDRYEDRLILFDLPPVLGGDDVMAFAPYVDALLLVIEDGKTTKEQLSSAYALLDEGANILGTVLNKADKNDVTAGSFATYYRSAGQAV